MPLTHPYLNFIINHLHGFASESITLNYFGYKSNVKEISKLWGDDKIRKETIDNYISIFEQHLPYFEEELFQFVTIGTQTSITFYFEKLREFASNFRRINKKLMRDRIIAWNEQTHSKFLEEIELEFEVYSQDCNIMKYDHLEEFEIESHFTDIYRNLKFQNIEYIGGENKVKVVNYRYYCLRKAPALMDLDLIDQFLKFLQSMYGRFLLIADKHLELYDKGKYVGNANIMLQSSLENSPSQISLPIEDYPKLIWNDTVEEFMKIFHPLITNKQIYFKYKTKNERDPIVKILHKMFYIRKSIGDLEELAEGSLCTYFKNYIETSTNNNNKL